MASARVSRAIGALVGLTGLVYLVQGVGWSALPTVVSAHTLEGDLGYYAPLLVLGWSIGLLVVARKGRRVSAAAAG